MGGVGKTTLLTQINNKFCDTPNDLDFVIWVVVSKQLQVEKIQDEIGKKIGLFNKSWERKGFGEKAVDILQILRSKRFILLLDDIWEWVNLAEAGVPLPRPESNKSKFVFTTRFLDVCCQMGAQEKIEVKCLGDEEACKLFQEKVGTDIFDSHSDVSDLSRTVVKECRGLPLALVTIGRAMAGKMRREEWEYAIEVLRSSASKFSGMQEKVYTSLKFSYDSLSGEATRSCFLYCSLFPEDYSIDKEKLIDYWVGEGFLDGRIQGYSVMSDLIRACLLEEVALKSVEYTEGGVKMHDVVRDMSLWIVNEIEKEKGSYLVVSNANLTEVPKISKLGGVRRMYFMKNIDGNLSEAPKCRDLVTLFVYQDYIRKIPNDFFQHMTSLRFLNLSSSHPIIGLPSGILKLALLQYLDISSTWITRLPEESKALVNLRCLILGPALCHIPRQLIASFSMLRVLRMPENYSSKAREDSILADGGELLVEELLHLKHLCALSITLRDLSALQRLLSSHKLLCCTETLRLYYFNDLESLDASFLEDMKHLRRLRLFRIDLEEITFDFAGRSRVQKNKQVPGFYSLHTVEINSCFYLKDATWLIFAPNLKNISLINCLKMEKVICTRKLGEVPEMMQNLVPFEKLKILSLSVADELQSIHPNALPFPHLKQN